MTGIVTESQRIGGEFFLDRIKKIRGYSAGEGSVKGSTDESSAKRNFRGSKPFGKGEGAGRLFREEKSFGKSKRE